MEERYILAVDQSTQGTKGLLFDEQGRLVERAYCSHEQYVPAAGWVEHDPGELILNTINVSKAVIEKARIEPGQVAALGISNQRETTIGWNRETGRPICNAIVWQCSRAVELAERHRAEAEYIRKKTGMPLSPYFPAAKMSWLMENVPAAANLANAGSLCLGTIDSWLLFHLTEERVHKTDYSNASRTQLFSLKELCWDWDICNRFHIPMRALPEVCMSDSCFGHTTMWGLFPEPIPVRGVLGDSHSALFGQNCRQPGQIKATYGTGSSVMVYIGDRPVLSDRGIVTSIAWGMNGKVEYVFEGNLNYTGAVISWLKDELRLISTPAETAQLAAEANPKDRTYFIPAFTGLGAPYWDSHATGLLTGITRTTGRKEIVKACLECTAYQIADLLQLMRAETGRELDILKVDGGLTQNRYLMQFQSDMAKVGVQIPQLQEMSGMGAAFTAGISIGMYDADKVFSGITYEGYRPRMEASVQKARYQGWREALRKALMREL